MEKVRTRFAPSPTGYMHIGNLRTALYEYLVAKKDDGTFILRIEDTDQERLVEGAVDLIYSTLKECGLEHDEGPDIGGDYGSYVQSERMASGIYKEYAEKLIELGGAHYCFCSEDDIHHQKEEAEAKGVSFKYNDPCHNMTLEEARQRIANGEKYVVRQNIPLTGTTSFDDEVYGHIEVENSILDESILLKSDGFPTYNFANIIDDHMMNITHVVRGNEYLSSTPKYNLVYQTFGWNIPKYIHLPPVMKDEHHKLSKRNGDASFQDLVAKGYLPAAILNYIALLGWSPETEQEIYSLDELKKAFSVERISKSPAIFDIEKLTWMNGMYIRSMSLEQFHQLALPHLHNAVKGDFDLLEISKILQPRVSTLNEIDEMVDFFDVLPEYDIAMYTHKKMKTDPQKALEVLKELLPILENQGDFSNDALFETLKAFAGEKGYKIGYVMWPIRTAVSGKQNTPGGATEIMEVLGKEESLKRIRAGVEKLSEQA